VTTETLVITTERK